MWCTQDNPTEQKLVRELAAMASKHASELEALAAQHEAEKAALALTHRDNMAPALEEAHQHWQLVGPLIHA